MLTVPPQADELLSAYLVRLSHAHGLSPTRFCAFHFAAWPIWTRDIDRSAPLPLLSAVANATGLETSQVEALTLHALEQRLAASPSHAGRAQGIGAIGVYHRRRQAFGLRYCTACLAGGGSLLRAWRIEALMSCAVHQTVLWDACTTCGAALELHHQRRRLGVCHACHHVLGAGAAPLVLGTNALRFQRRIRQAITSGSVMGMQPVAIDVGDWLAGLALIQRVCGPAPPRTPPRDVHARAHHRLEQAEWTAAQLVNWPSRFEQTCCATRITQRRIEHAGSVPSWLAPLVAQLPAGSARPRLKAPSVSALARDLAKLQGSRPIGWRSQRAALLLGHGSRS